MTPEKLEIFTSLEGWVENNILTFLKPVETLWQPQDFLPNPSCPNEEFFKSIMEIREQAEEIVLIIETYDHRSYVISEKRKTTCFIIVHNIRRQRPTI